MGLFAKLTYYDSDRFGRGVFAGSDPALICPGSGSGLGFGFGSCHPAGVDYFYHYVRLT